MSSIFLNFTDIALISRLLRETRLPDDTQDLRTEAARYLALRFQEGTYDADHLRVALKQFLKKHRAPVKATGH